MEEVHFVDAATVGITCVLIDVVFFSLSNDRPIVATLSSTFDLTYHVYDLCAGYHHAGTLLTAASM